MIKAHSGAWFLQRKMMRDMLTMIRRSAASKSRLMICLMTRWWRRLKMPQKRLSTSQGRINRLTIQTRLKPSKIASSGKWAESWKRMRLWRNKASSSSKWATMMIDLGLPYLRDLLSARKSRLRMKKDHQRESRTQCSNRTRIVALCKRSPLKASRAQETTNKLRGAQDQQDHQWRKLKRYPVMATTKAHYYLGRAWRLS